MDISKFAPSGHTHATESFAKDFFGKCLAVSSGH